MAVCQNPRYPFCSHKNSWDLWMFIPLKMVLIGIDPYPYLEPLKFRILYRHLGVDQLGYFLVYFPLMNGEFSSHVPVLEHRWDDFTKSTPGKPTPDD